MLDHEQNIVKIKAPPNTERAHFIYSRAQAIGSGAPPRGDNAAFHIYVLYPVPPIVIMFPFMLNVVMLTAQLNVLHVKTH